MKAQRVKWRSPAWQDRNTPRAKWCRGVRLFPQGKILSMEEIAALCAFFSIPLDELKRIAKLLGVDLRDAATLYQVLIRLIMHILKINEDAAAEVVAQRLRDCAQACQQYLDEVSDILMNCDEAAQCLAQADQRLVDKEQKDLQAKAAEMPAFEVEFRQASRARHAAGTSAGGASSSGSKTKTKLNREKLAMADHAAAKPLMPPCSYLWKSRATSSWSCRVPPFTVHCRTVAKPDALHWVICRAWEDYCLLRGIEMHEAPVEGYLPAA